MVLQRESEMVGWLDPLTVLHWDRRMVIRWEFSSGSWRD